MAVRVSALLIAVCPTLCLGQPSGDDRASMLDMDLAQLLRVEVVTASRLSEGRDTAPGTVMVVTRQQIRERGYLNLLDALQDLPGIDIQNYSDDKFYNRIAFRGISGNNRFLILQNGRRISSPTGDPIVISHNFPLYSVQQIEVVYGPSSAVYGADAFGGVINLITDAAGEQTGLRARVIGGDNGLRYGNMHWNHALSERVALSLGWHSQRADNPDRSRDFPQLFPIGDLRRFDGSLFLPAEQRQGYWGATRSHSGFLQVAVGADFDLQATQSSFTLPTSTQTLSSMVDYGQHPSWTTQIDTINGEYRHRFNERWDGSVSLGCARYQAKPDTFFANIFVDYLTGYYSGQGDKCQWETRGNYAYADGHSVDGGLVYQDFSAFKAHSLQRPLDHSNPQGPGNYYIGSNQTLPAQIQSDSYRSFGAYLQSRNQWTRTLSSNIGLRFDHDSNYGSTLNPRASLIYRPAEATSAKLTYGEAFLAPSPFFRFEHFGIFSGQQDSQGRYVSSFMRVPNFDLKPEQLKSLELSLSHQFSAGMNVGLVLYRVRADQLIAPAPTATPESDFVPGGFVQFTDHNDNIGDVRLWGADLTAEYEKTFTHGKLKVWGSLSRVDGRLHDQVRNLEQGLPYVSRDKAKLGLTWVQRDLGHASVIARYVGPALLDNSNGFERGLIDRQAPGYAVVDLFVGAERLIGPVGLALKVTNLFDRRYYHAAEGFFSTFDYAPQDSRQIWLSAAFEM